jgi:hypothetical protein
MTLNWTTTARVGATGGIKAVVYGGPGVGKTRLLCTAPSPLIVSSERGLLSVRHLSVPVLEVSSLAEVKEVLDWLEGPDPVVQTFKTICLDSLSETAEVVLAEARLKNRDPRKAFGALIEEMLPVIKRFRDLKQKNVVMVCKSATTKNELSGAVTTAPSAPGNVIGAEIPYLFDAVLHLAVGTAADGTSFRYLRTQPDATTSAKDRSDNLAEIEVADLTYLFGKMT